MTEATTEHPGPRLHAPVSSRSLAERAEPLLPPVEAWQQFRKTSITSAIRITGPFRVETSEGPLECEDGWLAVDARGYPYPIADDEFQQIYTPASDVDDGELYAIPGVGRESGEAIVTLQWGAQTGQVDPDASRTLGMALIEAAEVASVEALMLAWLTRDGDGDKTGAARILEGFRQFRAAEAAVEEPVE